MIENDKASRAAMVFGILSLCSVCGCSTSIATLNIYQVSENDVTPDYSSKRKSRFALVSDQCIFRIDNVPKGGVVYEPSPVYYEFAVVAGIVTVNEYPSGSIFLVAGKHREIFRVSSAQAKHNLDGMTEIDLEATNAETCVVIHLVGKSEKDADSLRKEVAALIEGK